MITTQSFSNNDVPAGIQIELLRIYARRVNPLTPELNPSAQRCLTRFFTGDFAS
jgi:hypothetical protein